MIHKLKIFIQAQSHTSCFDITKALHFTFISLSMKHYDELKRLRTYFVTLNILSSLRALRTDSPNDPDLRLCQITSKIDPLITTQSKRLKADSKYIRGPNAYILMNISIIKSPKKPHSAYSVTKFDEN